MRGPSAARDGSLRQFVLAARHPPLWARWLITILAFAVLVVAVAIVVRSAGSGNGSSQSEAAAVAEANREGQIAIAQDEAPHAGPLRPGVSVEAALARAITDDVHGRIEHGELTGPLQGVRCRAKGPPVARRRPFSCTVLSAGIAYPFLAVADEQASQLTWCKLDLPAVADAPLEVPVSPRCEVRAG